jgi:hypothetical protein
MILQGEALLTARADKFSHKRCRVLCRGENDFLLDPALAVERLRLVGSKIQRCPVSDLGANFKRSGQTYEVFMQPTNGNLCCQQGEDAQPPMLDRARIWIGHFAN